MTAKHTPGPWVVKHKHHVLNEAANGTWLVATVADRESADANARLIAAAPDNLVEHRALLHLADTLNSRQHAGLEITPAMWGALYDQANRSRAAIAKAEGREI